MRKSLFFLIAFALLLCGCKQSHLQKANKLYNKRDFQEALFHYEQSCLEGEIFACKMTATLYQEDKHNIPSSKAKALKALESACSYGDLPSCKIVYKAYTLLNLKDLAQKTLYYSCKGGEVTSCLKLAQKLYSPKNFQQSLDLAKKRVMEGVRGDANLLLLSLKDSTPQLLISKD